MKNLLNEIAHILNCTPNNVQKRLSLNEDSEYVFERIKNKLFKTTYSDRNGNQKMINCKGITTLGAHQIKAFGNLTPIFNVSVAAYFFVHHGIKINYPYHQCIFEWTKNKKNENYTFRYYPIELVQFEEPPLLEIPPSTSLLSLPDFCDIFEKNIEFKLGTSSSASSISGNSTDDDQSCSKGILWLYRKENKLWDKRNVWISQKNHD
ncbi:PAZ domain-containing protein [Meloidogyne graminicola]|uniref:PAZ domain-containing protein n=1 Tax=Meloidogyne graminicola TaxID=189291 RepID=A0A8T0A0W3_9BILA|nr:PAZ domain-containing protein [Meloidogyne graminicola]